MNLHGAEEGDGVFRHDDDDGAIPTGDSAFRDRNVVPRAVTAVGARPRARLFLLLTACLAFAIGFTVLNLERAELDAPIEEEPQANNEPSAKKERDPFFFEPETKIIEPHIVQPETLREAACSDFDLPLANRTDSLQWVMQGQELVKHIQEKYVANLQGGQWSNHFGYGDNVAMSGDGQRMAVSYEGVAGFDKTFGSHIDVLVFNGTHWDLEQTVTDVKRGRGHEKDVRYQSMALSANGQRLAFSDGHGVKIFQLHSAAAGGGSKQPHDKKWQPLTPIQDPLSPAGLDQPENDKLHQFGLDIAINCDGSVLAISGSSQRNSYTRIYQEQPDTDPVQWVPIGEIQGVKFGGSIKLNARGSRLVMGTMASQGWRGIVQIFDRGVGKNKYTWTRVGQPIVGKAPLEMWGGTVAMSADGETVVVTSNDGDTNRVQAYRLLSNNNATNTSAPPMWQPYGPELHGTGNQYEHFGADIALSHDGTILAVGAPGDFDLYTNSKNSGKAVSPADAPFVSGRIYMYQLSASFANNSATDGEKNGPDWTRIDNGELVSIGVGGLFGKSVAMSAGGTFVVGGAPKRTGLAYQHILGSAHAYQAV